MTSFSLHCRAPQPGEFTSTLFWLSVLLWHRESKRAMRERERGRGQGNLKRQKLNQSQQRAKTLQSVWPRTVVRWVNSETHATEQECYTPGEESRSWPKALKTLCTQTFCPRCESIVPRVILCVWHDERIGQLMNERTQITSTRGLKQ